MANYKDFLNAITIAGVTLGRCNSISEIIRLQIFDEALYVPLNFHGKHTFEEDSYLIGFSCTQHR